MRGAGWVMTDPTMSHDEQSVNAGGQPMSDQADARGRHPAAAAAASSSSSSSLPFKFGRARNQMFDSICLLLSSNKISLV